MARKPTTDIERYRGGKLADRLQKTRERVGFTQSTLSEKSGIGIDTLRAIEGKRILNPGVFTLKDIADALGVGIDELVPKKGSGKIKKSRDQSL